MMDSFLSIGEIAKKADISASALRYYESIGMIPVPKRISGKRCYTIDVLNQLNFIRIAQFTGFSNQEITVLLEGFDNQAPPSERWQQMANTKCLELEEKKRQIDTMINILNNGLECECLNWSECFTKVNSK
ncbi:MerR family DNA-binding transcriptional regulator [Sutcliffiella halmapala]